MSKDVACDQWYVDMCNKRDMELTEEWDEKLKKTVEEETQAWDKELKSELEETIREGDDATLTEAKKYTDEQSGGGGGELIDISDKITITDNQTSITAAYEKNGWVYIQCEIKSAGNLRGYIAILDSDIVPPSIVYGYGGGFADPTSIGNNYQISIDTYIKEGQVQLITEAAHDVAVTFIYPLP